MENTREELFRAAFCLLKDAKTVVLATSDSHGEPRPVPMHPIAVEEDLSIWLSTNSSAKKIEHINRHPGCGVTFFNAEDSVCLQGNATIIRDPLLKKQCWKPWMQKHFSQGVADPSYAIIYFKPIRGVFYLDGSFLRIDHF